MYINAVWWLKFCMSVVFRSCGPSLQAVHYFAERW